MTLLKTKLLRCAALPLDNINTDNILPASFMITTKRDGLSSGLFYNWRFDSSGKPISDFVLNRADFSDVNALVAGHNFGCGSSREHAVWALREFGIGTVFAPSFNETFANNAAKNGLATICLGRNGYQDILAATSLEHPVEIDINLNEQMLRLGNNHTYCFELTQQQKKALIFDITDLSIALDYQALANTYWKRTVSTMPWLNPEKA